MQLYALEAGYFVVGRRGRVRRVLRLRNREFRINGTKALDRTRDAVYGDLVSLLESLPGARWMAVDPDSRHGRALRTGALQ
jgi:hypothetical protein